MYLTSGIERMILELVRRSRHDWVVYTSHYNPGQTYPEFRDVSIVELSNISVSRKYKAVSSAAVSILTQKIKDLDSFDALVVSSEGLGDLITFRNHSIPVICYCHTPMKVIHDSFTRQRYLQNHRKMAPAFYLYAALFNFFDRLAWKHYSHVFCNSGEVKKRIIGARLAGPEKIEVLHPGLDTSTMNPKWEYRKYFLVAGRIKWFKNIELAIEAFRLFKARYPRFADFELRIAGLVEPRSEAYLQKLQALAAGEKVVFVRNPPDELLMDTYAECYALIFPSLNEDWGMVPLEAMGFGKPVIAINRGGPTESVSDGETGFLVDDDPAAFAEAMARLADDPALNRTMGEAACASVRKYDWSRFVERFDDYLDSLPSRV